MGKKGSKLLLIKRFFSCHSADKKPRNGTYKNRPKEGKKLSRGESKSKWFVVPAISFREPSSIEQILGDHETDQMVAVRSAFSPKASSSNTDVSGAMTSCSRRSFGPSATHGLRKEEGSATMIQSAYRGYLVRRNLKSVRGVGRLQGVMSGQNMKIKTMNDIKQMQRFVKVQMQVQSGRLQRLQNQHQTKSIQTSEAGKNEDWDDSLLTMEELEARRKQKVDAAIKRERAISYAKQIHKSGMKSANDNPSNSHPWWWKWLEGELPLDNGSQSRADDRKATFTPPRSVSILSKSKVRASSNPKERVRGTEGNESRRSSFSPNRNMSLLKINSDRHSSPRSMGDNLSLVSTDSRPARKPFNRFV